jgi:Predicted periplasmic lipoprotein
MLVHLVNRHPEYNEWLRKATHGQNKKGEIMNEWNKDGSCMLTTLPFWGSRIGNDARSWPAVYIQCN